MDLRSILLGTLLMGLSFGCFFTVVVPAAGLKLVALGFFLAVWMEVRTTVNQHCSLAAAIRFLVKVIVK